MFYKLMNNDFVVDLLRKICYVRYLSKSKRWVVTDPQSAHGIRGSNQDTIYLLEGRICGYEGDLTRVRVEKISEEEYSRLANEVALRTKEKEELINRIDSLEEALARQTALLEAVLAKLDN